MAEETTQSAEQTTVNQNLTVNDLIVLKNVIEVCSQRGAFKADEFETVGGVYKKLVTFLSSILPAAPNEENQGES